MIREVPNSKEYSTGLLQWLEGSDLKVLDVGGGVKPLLRADWVIDLIPYSKRGSTFHSINGVLRFNRERWIEKDVCDGLPFGDKEFDYVWSTQLVEDVRDPIGLCREMQRIGKAGYIATVHWTCEATVHEGKKFAGFGHHRWLVDLREDTLTFAFKPPTLWTLPHVRPVQRQHILAFEWENEFQVREEFYSFHPGNTAEEYLLWRKNNL